MKYALYFAILLIMWNLYPAQGASENMHMNTNRLANESSPYLKQHQHNPVDWYPWGDEAFEKAKAEDKPIFLSVGYSSCHWCHVMAHESFENESVATILNEHYVSIKVDREEHPDIDALYMAATHLLTQRGGWPNSVWLTPDARPWYAGTYFPREDQGGRIGFKTLLNRLATVWKEQRKDVEQQADQMTEAIRQQNSPQAYDDDQLVNLPELLKNAQDNFSSRFDTQNGGFGGAPKFPPHSGLLLLIGLYETNATDNSAAIIEQTLDAMARGGIYDQIGGGFHRYSTDEHWLLPHFEKMLYDNATLIKAYARGFKQFGKKQYKRIIDETTDWIDREMTHPDGGFFAALDADSDGEEGKFYTWSYNEIMKTLGDELGQQFSDVYTIIEKGNFRDEASGQSTGLNIPHLAKSTSEDIVEKLKDARDKLLEQRAPRVRPGLDNKVITAWNGLMISALAEAGRLLDEEALVKRAQKARDFIDVNLIKGDTILRSWCDGVAEIEGVLDDYASVILADLDLYAATDMKKYLESAEHWMTVMYEKFADPNTGDLYMTPNDHGTSLLRVREVYDQGSPSGIGLAAQAVVRLGSVTTNEALLNKGGDILSKNHVIMSRAPSGVSTLVEAAHLLNQQFESYVLSDESSVNIKVGAVIIDNKGAGEISVEFSLPENWYVNPEFDIQLEADKVKLIKAEKPSDTNQAWKLLVFLGDMTQSTIKGTMTYQLCTDSVCMIPDSVSFEIPIEKK